jgi:hypothetical protein
MMLKALVHDKKKEKNKEKDKDKEKDKPISINLLLMPLSFTPGSMDSLEQLGVLKEKGMSHLYESTTAQNFVDYKMTRVRHFGLLKLFFYCMYLLLINVYAERWLMIFWAGYFSAIELIQIYGLGFDGFYDFWNMMDYTRILLIIMFVV